MMSCDRPRLALGVWPTPLRRASRLEAQVGGGPLLVKRDDLSGFALAGNKARSLEYLLGDATASGYDAIVVGGVATSNFCQAAAVAAQAAGLDCHIVLPGRRPPDAATNLMMAVACGAHLTFSGGPREELDDRIRDRAAELIAAGRSAVAIPRGGANPLGSLGFVQAAHELSEQLSGSGYGDARIVLAVGSGASVAGLLVGASELGAGWTITGVSVSRPLRVLVPHLESLVDSCARLLGTPAPDASALLLRESLGAAHGGGNQGTDAAALLGLKTEGLVLDTDYTAPAFRIAVQQLTEPGPPVVFWHTGGLAGAVSEYLAAGHGVETSQALGSLRSGGRP